MTKLDVDLPAHCTLQKVNSAILEHQLRNRQFVDLPQEFNAAYWVEHFRQFEVERQNAKLVGTKASRKKNPDASSFHFDEVDRIATTAVPLVGTFRVIQGDTQTLGVPMQ